ncbi:MAG: sulfatase [Gemmatimonadota bacterium]
MTSPSPDSTPAQPRAGASIVDVLWLAVTGAALVACLHVAQVEFRFRVLKEFTWTSREFAWLSFGGYLAWFLAAAIPVALLVTVMRRWAGLRLAVSIFASLAVFAVLLLYQKIHPVSQVILAIGLGTVIGARVAADRTRSMRLIRRLAVGGVVALGITGLLSGTRLRASAAPATPAAIPEASDAPNIVLLILDTVRASSLSLYGYARPTSPVLDALAHESTVFDLAFSAAPWTAPSHASMMTGLWASQAGADYLNPMYDSLTTVAQVLTKRGYATGGFMANAGYAGYQLGISRGFSHYEDFPFSFRQALWSTTLSQTGSGRLILEGLENGERWKLRRAITNPNLRTEMVRKSQPQSAGDIARNFFTWHDGERRRPYFAMLNFMDAHAPYEPPPEFRTRFDGGKTEQDRYDGGIAYEDSIIGSIVDRLRERGDLERTVLIVTADHGEQFGEHGIDSHGNSLYLPLLHVPLLVRAPGRVPAGQRIASIVSLRDMAATLLDLGGAPAGTLPGISLAHAWSTGSSEGQSPIMAEAAAAVNPSKVNLTRFGPIKATIDSAGHFIHYGNGKEQFFAWRTDTAEVNDLSATPAGQAALPRYRAAISALLGVGWPPPRSRLH